MFVKTILLGTLCTFAQGAYISTPSPYYPYSTPAVASHSQSVIRSLDGSSVLSSYSKAVDTPHSSVRKYDTRLSNDAVYHVPTIYQKPYVPVHYSPSYVPTYISPKYVPSYSHNYASSPSYVPAYAPYSAPSTPYLTPSYVKHVPAHVSYSESPAVSHISFDGFGTHYGW